MTDDVVPLPLGEEEIDALRRTMAGRQSDGIYGRVLATIDALRETIAQANVMVQEARTERNEAHEKDRDDAVALLDETRRRGLIPHPRNDSTALCDRIDAFLADHPKPESGRG